jgi:hypothetical protein
VRSAIKPEKEPEEEEEDTFNKFINYYNKQKKSK